MQKRKYTENGITFIEMPASMLKVVWLDRKKKSGAQVTRNGNYCNANFFGNYIETGVYFTLPAGHLKCDIYPGFTLHATEMHYMRERGKIEDNKFIFNSGTWTYDNPCGGKAVSTLCLKNGQAFIQDIVNLNDSDTDGDTYGSSDYVVSGVPVLRQGKDVSFYNYVVPQGWGADTVRATYHVFVGTKQAHADKVYVMYYKSTKSNLIYSAEFYNKIKDLGFYDIIKLDGGGSFIVNSPDLGILTSTGEDRIINAVLTFDEPESDSIDLSEYVKKSDVQAQLDSVNKMLESADANLQDARRLLKDLLDLLDACK